MKANITLCALTALLVVAAIPADEQQPNTGAKPLQDVAVAPVGIDAVTTPEPSLDPIPATDPIEPTTVEVRVRGWDIRTGQAVHAWGWGVVVGDKIYAPAHMLTGTRASGRVIEAKDGDTWRAVNFVVDGKLDKMYGQFWQDGFEMNTNGIQKSRRARYGERVRVITKATGRTQCGTVFNVVPLQIGLDVSEPGIKPGDSGSPIVAESDGAVLGIANHFSATAGFEEPRSIGGEDISEGSLVADAPPATPAQVMAPPVQAPLSNSCPTGVCPSPSSGTYRNYFLPRVRRWR